MQIGDVCPDSEGRLNRQDAQLAEFRRALSLDEAGSTEEAIQLLEDIAYKQGLVVCGTAWPFVLSDMYIRNKMHDRCWKYLNFLASRKLADLDKITDIQSLILKKEGKYLDSLQLKMIALLLKYGGRGDAQYKPAVEKVERELQSLIRKAGLVRKQTMLIELYNRHVESSPFKEALFREDFKAIIGQ